MSRSCFRTGAALVSAISEVRGPHRVTTPNPEDTFGALEKYGRDLTAEAESGSSIR